MPKVNITFDLENLDDKEDFKRYHKAVDMACALFDISYNLRRSVEKSVDYLHNSGGDYDEAELIYREINNIIEKYNINIDEIIS